MKKSILSAVLAMLASVSLTACNSDSMVAFFHSPGLTILYVGDDVEFPPVDPSGPGSRGGGPGGGGAAPGAANADGTTTLATFANDRYRVRKFEESAIDEVFYTVTDLEGNVLRARLTEGDFSLKMPGLFREMESSL